MNVGKLWCVSCSPAQNGVSASFSVDSLDATLKLNVHSHLNATEKFPPEIVLHVCESEDEARKICSGYQDRRDELDRRDP